MSFVSLPNDGMNRDERFQSDVARLALLMGLCAAIGVYLIVTTEVITRDGVFYIQQARLLSLDPIGVCRQHPPGYPFMLWAGHRVANLFVPADSPALWVYSAQGVTLLCRVLALLPLFALGKRLVGAANSFWALLVLILLPYPAFYGSDVLREWPYLLFLSTGVFLLHRSLTIGRLWMLALVGLDAGLGYLIRPECAQLLLYALLGLLVAPGWSGAMDRASREEERRGRDARRETRIMRRLGAGLVMVAAFAAPVAPYVRASGSILPQQLRTSPFNLPPVISAVGPKAAAATALEFAVRPDETLELPIRASDPEGDALSFAVVSVPATSRPVYEFRSAVTGASFWTISEQEKDLLLIHHLEVWQYRGIAWYASMDPGARPGLQPVYRFWSPAQQRHFYTMSESEKEAVLAESAAESWAYEGPVFYGFEEKTRPADAVAVYRLWDPEHGYSWTTTPPTGPDAREYVAAWYVHQPGAPPAGAGIEHGVLRWRPDLSQQGVHGMNIVVSDGNQPNCQLLTIHVTAAGSAKQDPAGQERPRACASVVTCDWKHLLSSGGVLTQSLPLRRLAGAVSDVVGGIGEDFMVIPMLPWILGLYYCLKNRAGTVERVLILAIVIVNLGLMLGRQVWIGPGSDRRYGVGLIALTIFYLPAGLDIIARALGRMRSFRSAPASAGAERRSGWFYLLAVCIIVLCTPKLLLTPLRAQKAGLRAAGEWLRQNTPTDAVIAEPDGRISLYAERQGLPYERYPNTRKADYVVEIAHGDPALLLHGWTRVHSVALGPGDDRTIHIHHRARTKG